MQGNDLDNSPVQRIFVVSDVVFYQERVNQKTLLRRSKTKTVHIASVAVLAKLWRYSSNSGRQMELVFIGDEAQDAVRLWDELESELNPFTGWSAFETVSALASRIPYRPDLFAIVDIPSRTAVYGGKGLRVEDLP